VSLKAPKRSANDSRSSGWRMAYGKSRPRATNLTASGRALNRRVQVVLLR
jgi:hypothetical protein